MRLINGDALHIAIEIYMAENSYINDTALDVLKMIAGWVEETRTIEAEPVRHGRWVQMAGFTACSECGASPADWEAKPDNPLGVPPYCHSCGAKMDGGDGA